MILFEVLKFAVMSVVSLFCTMTNTCTIISQIITLLHVSTLVCHPQGACNQYHVKLHNKWTIISQINTLLHVSTISCHPQGAYNQYLVKLHNKCTIISQIIPLLHVSTLSCHPQGACNQYIAKLQVTTSQGIHYKLPENDRIVSKHVGV